MGCALVACEWLGSDAVGGGAEPDPASPLLDRSLTGAREREEEGEGRGGGWREREEGEGEGEGGRRGEGGREREDFNCMLHAHIYTHTCKWTYM